MKLDDERIDKLARTLRKRNPRISPFCRECGGAMALAPVAYRLVECSPVDQQGALAASMVPALSKMMGGGQGDAAAAAIEEARRQAMPKDIPILIRICQQCGQVSMNALAVVAQDPVERTNNVGGNHEQDKNDVGRRTQA